MPVRHSLIHASFDARWYHLRRLSALHAPYHWQRWLTDRGSLTQHLMNASQGHFSVEVIAQGWGRPNRSEAQILGMPPRQLALIREVHLLGNQEPWVYARSIIPATTLTGRERQLHHVGNRSLGSVLFNDRTMRRGPLEVSRFDITSEQTLWARRSQFYLSGKPLLVCEVFLPALEQVNYQPTTS